MRMHTRSGARDRGSILVLTLVMAVVLSAVIAAVASYVTSGLTYGRVVEERADRLAAADGGLRYALELLEQSRYAGCLTSMGNTGYSLQFPAKINDADVKVTCTKGATGIGDIKAWAIIVTGEGVPNGQWMLQSQAGGGIQKLLGGPVWVTDPSRMDLKAPVTVEDGDIWYYSPTGCDNPSLTLDSNLTFKPDYRGTQCNPTPWTVVYSDVPDLGQFAAAGDSANTNPAPYVDANGCTVFSPGRYTVAPTFGANTYLKSGNYYFENLTLDVSNAVVTGGWADQVKYGDKVFVPNFACTGDILNPSNTPNHAMVLDKASGSAAGATLYLGGNARIEIGNKGSLEIMRRLQADAQSGGNLVSIQAMDSTTSNYTKSTLGYNDNVVVTKSGNNADLAIHGLLYAPKAQLEFGNVTNAANGQLLGGAAVARIVLQASASASAFIIRVETSPIDFELKVDSTATKNGQSTTMRAVVYINDQGEIGAVNSLRVLGL